MKKGYLIIVFILFSGNFLFGQDFQFDKWLVSKESVKTTVNGIFIEEIYKDNYMEELHFVNFDSVSATHMYYVFRKNQLIGIKTQKLRLSGDNSKLNALEDYYNISDFYKDKYGKENTNEKAGIEQSVNVLQVKFSDQELYVTIERNGSEYFVVENMFKLK